MEKAVEYLRRMAKRPKGLDAGHADQIDQLLERFDLKPISNKEVGQTRALLIGLRVNPDETGSRSGGIREQGLRPTSRPNCSTRRRAGLAQPHAGRAARPATR